METTTNPADQISQILNARAEQIYGDFTRVLEDKGVDFARRTALGYIKAHDGGRAVSRSTCQITNLVTDVERAAAFQFLGALEDAIGFSSEGDTDDDLAKVVRGYRYSRLG